MSLCLFSFGSSLRAATVDERLAEFGNEARARLKPFFDAERIDYPPRKLLLLGLKAEKRLEIYAGVKGGKFLRVRSYPILAASGDSGPKLEEGDLQVPEGFYRISLLNPNSLFHVSLRVDYPNAFDRARAHEEGRSQLGGDIMIHGNQVSIGCLAMGDEVAEDIFTLAADTGIKRIDVVLSPRDFRRQAFDENEGGGQAAWVLKLHRDISRFMTKKLIIRDPNKN